MRFQRSAFGRVRNPSRLLFCGEIVFRFERQAVFKQNDPSLLNPDLLERKLLSADLPDNATRFDEAALRVLERAKLLHFD